MKTIAQVHANSHRRIAGARCSLLPLAALTLSGAASAQSSVTLFGIIDTGVQVVRNSGGGSVTRLSSSGISASQIGFRGVEDLGGGLGAGFWLEGSIGPDDGTGRPSNSNNQASGAGSSQALSFNRRSTVSLLSPWGEVRLGRDFNPAYWNLSVFSAFSTLGVGGTQLAASIVTGATSTWTSNAIAYYLPANLGGIYGQVQHFRGENTSNSGAIEHDGTGSGLRLGYRAGPIDISGAVSRTERAGPLGDVRQANIGVSWDFDVVKLMAVLSRDRGSVGTVAADGRGWSLGVVMPVGAGDIRLGASQYTTELATGTSPQTRKVAIAYRHYLSKRTTLYTAFARGHNSDGAAASVVAGAGSPAANRGSSGFDFGIRHGF
ncbi:porin [Variovorax sp. N23]|uniref:porin n=1 Tax=Variovorax sp. N23 TaxID=2980555 RepID=UPI0021C7AC66|nr:porin [Variovorax sp. N23]MCU4119085.1 porin [Variovorax sp. N23]